MGAKIVNWDVIPDGAIIGRKGTGLFSRAVMWMTKGLWSHDAIVIRTVDGQRWVGNALLGKPAGLMTLEAWEEELVAEKGARAIFLWPAGATLEQGRIASATWLRKVKDRRYDTLAIIQIGIRTLFGLFWREHKPVGLQTNYFCTEGDRTAWGGAEVDPWKKTNPTPGTTCKRWLQHIISEIADSFTAEGIQYRVEETA